jgi:hypothetical protein
MAMAMAMAMAMLLFLFFFVFYTCFLFHCFEAEGVGKEGLVCSLFLLLDCKKWVFANFGSSVSSTVGILNSDEVLMRSPDLNIPGSQ